MDLKDFVRKEISGWKRYEILAIIFVFCLILYNTINLHDSIIAFLSASFGILYTIFAGKGKISCYFFGLAGSVFYVSLSLLNHFWGNAVLYTAYYIPMQINGIFLWQKHLDKSSLIVQKTKLTFDKRIKFTVLGFLGCTVTCTLLYFLKDANPLIDGITTFLSIIGMYFTVKRCIEQWIIWVTVNGLSFLMWLDLVMHGAKVYSTLVMWGFYFILAIYFYFEWRKDIKNKVCQ